MSPLAVYISFHMNIFEWLNIFEWYLCTSDLLHSESRTCTFELTPLFCSPVPVIRALCRRSPALRVEESLASHKNTNVSRFSQQVPDVLDM